MGKKVRTSWLTVSLALLVVLLAASAASAFYNAYYPRPPYTNTPLHAVKLGTAPLPDCWNCHWFAAENSSRAPKYVSPKVIGAGGTTFDIAYSDWHDMVKTDRTGICQVCHTQTKYWGATYDYKAPATGVHMQGKDCRQCHAHFQTTTDPLNPVGLFSAGMLGLQSHNTHLSSADCKGPQFGDNGCTNCHSPNDYSTFGPTGQPFETTNICDPCHSPGGPVDGVNNTVIGAKPNWIDGVYDANNNLKPGKEHWCDGCHDSGTSVVKGVQAPNVLGNNSTYGYNKTGHGRNPANYKACLDCHTAACTNNPPYQHCDGDARTYSRAASNPGGPSNYVSGYRLRYDMNIPKWQEWGSAQYTLCLTCHDSGDLFNEGGIMHSNFRNDRRHLWNSQPPWSLNLHTAHLYTPPLAPAGPIWDSDWNGNNAEGGGDSTVSCPACHNVHGSVSPKMLRHGELDSIQPNLSFNWFSSYDLVTMTGTTTTSELSSRWGANNLNYATNHICSGCHGTGSDAYFRVPYQTLESLAPSQKLYNGLVWTSDMADNPKTSFKKGYSTIRVHVVYYVLPSNPAPPYNVVRKLNVFGANHQNTANSSMEGSISYYWDIPVPSGASNGTKTATVTIWTTDAPGTTFVQTATFTVTN
jgi:hypothetical protein